ncbi:DNA-directed RNA polymerase subunit delta [Oceanispirochaeta crateris]|uniref:DNA-directed RNA polymerase subunit delta n=1 Tax=Oceanispirochaeta crateris TaxID=2518645 RepID=A0A5C1QEV9_9SPIO|nr:SAM-dependent chlorinase/fluorinase [Oceanispirochaeta crateris]QEN06603.1 DNA-directed RNA polymerase subunit delta [Oceanispirochaeta crateris]
MEKAILVFQTDFTYKEGAVCSMYGVVKSVDRSLEIITGTHDIPQFDTWSASYRLYQSMKFWPEGTVFVSVVDPGVGTPRKASVALTNNGYYIVTPDNGSLTHVDKEFGIKEIREIDENVNRLKGKDTEEVSIFHGRDLFGFCAAKLASGIISFQEVGPAYSKDEIVRFPILNPTIEGGNTIKGIFEINDPNFGNLWTNIPLSVFKKAGFEFGDYLDLRICHKGVEKFSEKLLFHKSFGFAEKGAPVIYNNELMKISLAVSQGSFCEKYGIDYGSDWTVEFRK